jgi:hypothetical protein
MNDSSPAAAPDRQRFNLLVALLAATTTILVAVSGESFWIDEGGSAYKAIQPTLSGWWQAMLWEHNSNMQLPLYLIDLWVWEKIFGSGERILRLANAPFFLLTVYGLWLAFRNDPVRFNFSILFLLTNAFAWFYLNEARPYMLMLSGATLLFAAVYRLKQDPAQFGGGWAWLFAGAALLLCATSMIAAPWAACAFGAAWYVRGKYFPLEFIRRFPAAFAILVSGMLVIGGYYLWSLKIGADVPSMGSTGFANLAFAGYELFGFAGLGPARNAMRVEFLGAFHGYYLSLAIFGAGWGLTMICVLCKKFRPAFDRTVVFYLILFFPVIAIMLAGYLHGIRVLPRYLTPALPLVICLASYLASTLWRSGFLARGLVACLLAGALISALEIRFAPRHAKDDYRSAVAVAKKAVAGGDQIYWAADIQTALYYGLIRGEDRDTGTPQIVLFHAKDLQKVPPASNLFVLSKVDLYDQSGAIRKFLRDNGYRPAEQFAAFQLWRKPPAGG